MQSDPVDDQDVWLEEPGSFSLPYPGQRLAWALQTIGWSKNELARRLGCHQANVRQWINGRRRIPDVVGFWIEGLAKHHQAFELPLMWGENRPAQGQQDRFEA